MSTENAGPERHSPRRPMEKKVHAGPNLAAPEAVQLGSAQGGRVGT